MLMDNIHNPDAADRESTVLTGRQEDNRSRYPWHKPVLRCNDITQYTGFAPRAVSDDGNGFS